RIICKKNTLENKIQNHENLYHSTPKTPPIACSRKNFLPLEDGLFWPKTPKRKGKRNSERMPFVISSKKWKALFQEKANKKVKLQQDKKLRQEEREALDNNKRKLKKIKQKERNIMKTKRKAATKNKEDNQI
ncbi:hypothetical protein ILUMI_14184, partial [Ignelater luminosus]